MAWADKLSRALGAVLETVAIVLMATLTVLVLYAVVTRSLGASPSWYDEVASVMLAWLTYYAAALAALRRAHIGFDGLVMAMPAKARLAVALFAEAVVIAFFAVLAWTGYQVLQVLGGMSLVSLTWVPVGLTQSVIPIGAALFILAQLLSAPAYLAKVRAGVSLEREEIAHQIELAEKEIAGDAGEILHGRASKAGHGRHVPATHAQALPAEGPADPPAGGTGRATP